jgi:hypothetical protein
MGDPDKLRVEKLSKADLRRLDGLLKTLDTVLPSAKQFAEKLKRAAPSPTKAGLVMTRIAD